MLAHHPPSSEMGADGDTGEIKVTKKGISSLPHNADDLEVSSLIGISPLYES